MKTIRTRAMELAAPAAFGILAFAFAAYGVVDTLVTPDLAGPATITVASECGLANINDGMVKEDMDKWDMDKSDMDKSDMDKSDMDKSDMDKSDMDKDNFGVGLL